MSFSSFRTTDFLARFTEALEWVRNQGLTIQTDSRFEFYRRNIEDFINVSITGSSTVPVEDRERIFNYLANSFSEATELVYIYKTFRHGDLPFSKRKLGDALQGPIEYPLEESSLSNNHPRNIMFELFIGAMFQNAGYASQSGSNADLLFSAEDYSLYVECKRHMHSSSIANNIKRANAQLIQRFRTMIGPLKRRGLIALSLTRVINPDQKILRFSNEDEMQAYLKPKLLEIHLQLQSLLRDGVDRKVLGWIGLMRVPVVINDMISDVSMFNHSIFVNITHNTEPEHDLVMQLGETMRTSFQYED